MPQAGGCRYLVGRAPPLLSTDVVVVCRRSGFLSTLVHIIEGGAVAT